MTHAASRPGEPQLPRFTHGISGDTEALGLYQYCVGQRRGVGHVLGANPRAGLRFEIALGISHRFRMVTSPKVFALLGLDFDETQTSEHPGHKVKLSLGSPTRLRGKGGGSATD